MDKKTALFLFNSSDYAVAPWLADSDYVAVSVDYDDTDHSGEHRREDSATGHVRLSIDLSREDAREAVLSALEAHGLAAPSIVLSFAPCTDLAVSGAAHFAAKREKDPEFQTRATAMARLASTFGCPYAVENPVSVLASTWRKPDLYWHPCDYAGYCPEGAHPEFPRIIPAQDRYNKKSCLWVGNGFNLPAPQRMEPTEVASYGWSKLGGKSARTKYIRSLTPRGFAHAVYAANA